MMSMRETAAAPAAAPNTVVPVVIVPDQVQLDCPACDTAHQLTRGLDFDEAPDGRWRCTEAGGFIDTFECDCGQLLACAFTLTALPIPAPEPEPR